MNQPEKASDGRVAQDGGQSVAAVGGREDVVANGSKQEGFPMRVTMACSPGREILSSVSFQLREMALRGLLDGNGSAPS